MEERVQEFPILRQDRPDNDTFASSQTYHVYQFGRITLDLRLSIVRIEHRRAPGGLFVLHARAMPDNPYDGHILRDVIVRTETTCRVAPV